jgi:hypothetical protein
MRSRGSWLISNEQVGAELVLNVLAVLLLPAKEIENRSQSACRSSGRVFSRERSEMSRPVLGLLMDRGCRVELVHASLVPQYRWPAQAII